MSELSRRQVISGLAVLGLSATDVARVSRLAAQVPAVAPELVWPPVVTGIGQAFPTHDAATVKNLVGAAHRSLELVKAAVSRQPTLAKAAWDWGFGDWETALGAAAHTGQRAIAEYLMDQGAPPTIFSATMLGQLDVVKAIVAAQPGVQRRRGPHGITLLAHARAGGVQATSVVTYLESLGNADERPALQPITTEDRARLVGTYRFGPGPRDVLTVDDVRDQLGVTRLGAGRLILRRIGEPGEWVFYPSGAEAVRITFVEAGDRVSSVTIADPGVLLTATRGRE